MIKVLCVGGARPNFMKLAPLMRSLRSDPRFLPILVHTGQHYDDRMSGQFFRELGLTDECNLGVGSGSHAQQTAEIMKRFEPVLIRERASGVIVVGDVNSTMACALVASKLQVPVIHIEAGLRSFDRTMPEEINRVVTDAVADLLFLSEQTALQNLQMEGIPLSRIHFVGNLMIDSLRYHLEQAEQSEVLSRLRLNQPFGVVTLHRPSNVDNAEQFAEILAGLQEVAKSVPLYFPVHPRTRTQMERNGLCLDPGIHLIEPLGYLDFLCLMSHSSVVLTDSGGIQEETTALGIPCLTLRENTERPITIQEGTNRLAGTQRRSIIQAWEETLRDPKAGRIPKYWDGHTAERCVAALASFFH